MILTGTNSKSLNSFAFLDCVDLEMNKKLSVVLTIIIASAVLSVAFVCFWNRVPSICGTYYYQPARKFFITIFENNTFTALTSTNMSNPSFSGYWRVNNDNITLFEPEKTPTTFEVGSGFLVDSEDTLWVKDFQAAKDDPNCSSVPSQLFLIKDKIQIDSVDLVVPTTGTPAFAITVKNVGNKPATAISVKLDNETETYTLISSTDPLQPGQSVSVIENPRGKYIIGNSYVVTVTAQYSDGSTSSLVQLVICRGANLLPNGQVQIDTMDLLKSTEGDVIFTCTIKNTGNKSATSVNITLNGGDTDVVALPDYLLQPGQTAMYVAAPTEDYVLGNAYLVIIEVSYSDGSSSSCVQLVVCRTAADVTSVKAQVQIDTMDLVKPTEGDVVFTMTIKNGGNKPAVWISVTLASEDAVMVLGGETVLQPGQTVSYSASFDYADYVIGNAYLVTVEAGYTDGSTSSIVASVSCRS